MRHVHTADAPRPAEHKRLRETAARQRIAQRPRDRLLSDHIVEPLRPPFAGEDLVGHRRLFTIAEFRFQIAGFTD